MASTSPATTTTGVAPSSSSTTSTTVAAGSGPPAGRPVAAGFEPGSVTFVSTTTGYVLGADPSCKAQNCPSLVRTTDGGANWVSIPAPPAAYVARDTAQGVVTGTAVSELRFADPMDGWAYGPALFATHDGARTWQRVNLGGTVISLETAGGYVDAVVSPCAPEESCTGRVRLEQARAAAGRFTTVLTGPSQQTAGLDAPDLSLQPPGGFVILGYETSVRAELYATEDLGDPAGWNAFADPCLAAHLTGSELTSIIAPDKTTLYSLCVGNGGAGSTSKVVVVTKSGRSVVAGSAPRGGDGGMLAATASGTLVIGATSAASWLYRSTDGGRTWSTVKEYSDQGYGFGDLGFTTDTQGIVVQGLPALPAKGGPSVLLLTHDAGATWQPVAFGS